MLVIKGSKKRSRYKCQMLKLGFHSKRIRFAKLTVTKYECDSFIELYSEEESYKTAIKGDHCEKRWE